MSANHKSPAAAESSSHGRAAVGELAREIKCTYDVFGSIRDWWRSTL
jgi:hypothetical protein